MQLVGHWRVSDRPVPASALQKDGCTLLHRQRQSQTWPRGATEDRHMPCSRKCSPVSFLTSFDRICDASLCLCAYEPDAVVCGSVVYEYAMIFGSACVWAMMKFFTTFAVSTRGAGALLRV